MLVRVISDRWNLGQLFLVLLFISQLFTRQRHVEFEQESEYQPEKDSQYSC